MKLINEKQNVKGVSMQRFLQWYNKSTRNKIILFSVIFILALGYSFLHRPLGLIMWYHLNFIEEKEQVEMTRIHMDNKEKFLDLYRQYDIAHNFRKTQKEFFRYIDDFEIDLLASSFVGLSEWYLLAFVSKANIYASDLEWKTAYFIFKPYRLTKEQVQSYYDFLKAYNKVLFFVNRLDKNSHNANLITAKLYGNFFVFKFIGHFLPLTEEKCFMKDDILDIMQKSYIGLQQISNIKNYYVEKALDIAQNIYDDAAKDKLNECQ